MRAANRTLLFESFAELKIYSKHAIGIPYRNCRPALVQVPLHLYQLFLGAVQVRNVGQRNVLRHLLFPGQARLRKVVNADQRRIDLYAGGSEEALKPAVELRVERLPYQARPGRGEVARTGGDARG